MIEFLKCALWIFVLLILVCLGYAVLYWAFHCGSWFGLLALPIDETENRAERRKLKRKKR